VNKPNANTAILAALGAALILMLAALITMEIRSESQHNISQHFESSFNALVTLLDDTYQRRIDQVKSVAIDPIVVSAVAELLAEDDGEVVHEDLRRALSNQMGRNGVDGYVIIDLKHTIRDAWDRTLRGVKTSHEDEWDRRLDLNGVLVLPPFRAVARSVDAVQRGSEEYPELTCARIAQGGQVLALVCLRTNAELQLFNLLKIDWEGRTGEAYLIDRDGRLRTPSRFEGDFAGARTALEPLQISRLYARVPPPGRSGKGKQSPPGPDDPLTRIASMLLLPGARSTGYVSNYLDYRGKRVDGVGVWFTPLDLGLIKEVDHSELYASTDIAVRSLWTLAAASAFLLSVLGGLHTRSKIRLAASEARLASFFQNAPASMHIQDRSGRYVQVNPLYEQIIGIAAADLLGRNDFELKLLDDASRQARLTERTEVLQTGAPISVERRFLSADGVEHHARIVRFPIMAPLQGAPIGVGTVCVDVTEAVRTRESLQKMAQRLESEVAERTQDLIEARDAAEEAGRGKAQFLANMSHEIRTPLNAITGMSHLASRLNRDPKIEHYLRQIAASGQHLLGVVNEILDFSKIESGKLSLENVEFCPERLLIEVCDLVGPRAYAKRLEILLSLAPDVPALVRGDSKRIAQILINFADNAAKFTEAGQFELRVRSEGCDGTTARLIFEVEDSGPGIGEDQIPLLFQPFQQLESDRTRNHEGSGLGLAISQRLAELMGGEVTVRSRVGVGSCFTLTVTLEVIQGAPPGRPGDGLNNARALVVEDHTQAGLSMVELLGQMGISAETVASDDAALDRISSNDAQSVQSRFSVVFFNERRIQSGARRTGQLIGMLHLVHPAPFRVLLLPPGRPEPSEGSFEAVLRKPVTPLRLCELLRRMKVGEELQASLASPHPDTDAWARLMGKHVLLVEDNRVNQEVARDLLELAGMLVTTASDGMQALHELSRAQFDAILMDIHMPIMDGIDATRAIRRDSATARLPIIGLSASALAIEQQRCLEAGMVAFVAKPIVPSVLYATLDRWIKKMPGFAATPSAQVRTVQSPTDAKLLEALRGIDGLDVEQGRRYVMGRDSLYCSLVRRALLDRRSMLQPLSTLLTQNRIDEACRLVHNLGSVAGSLGALELRQRCLALESALRAGTVATDEISSVQQRAKQLWDLLDAAVRTADGSPQ
jgi:two-component system, sensor histidine kinase and response regulator